MITQKEKLIAKKKLEYEQEKLNKRLEQGIKTDDEILHEYNIKEQALKERMLKSGEQFD